VCILFIFCFHAFLALIGSVLVWGEFGESNVKLNFSLTKKWKFSWRENHEHTILVKEISRCICSSKEGQWKF
jgi:hypothetical protein